MEENVSVIVDKKAEKPLMVEGVPAGQQGVYAATLVEQTDHIEVHLLPLTGSGEDVVSYYLPWHNGECSTAAIDLSQSPIRYFFTAPLSGCSLWIKWSKPTVTILHEARTAGSVEAQHLEDGYQLIAKSQSTATVNYDLVHQVKTGLIYEIYALFAPGVATFHVQKIGFTKKLGNDGGPMTYELFEDLLKEYRLS